MKVRLVKKGINSSERNMIDSFLQSNQVKNTEQEDSYNSEEGRSRSYQPRSTNLQNSIIQKAKANGEIKANTAKSEATSLDDGALTTLKTYQIKDNLIGAVVWYKNMSRKVICTECYYSKSGRILDRYILTGNIAVTKGLLEKMMRKKG